MIFSNPEAFALTLIPFLMAILIILTFRQKKKFLLSMGEKKIIEKIMPTYTERYQRVKAFFILIIGGLFVIALAGPRWGQMYQEVQRRGIDIIMAIDVSKSMLAEDVQPNRLTQAKRELSLFINKLSGDRIGLIAFSGSAFLQCPLTLDYGAARSLLGLIDPILIPSPGTNLASAIETACNAFDSKEKKYKALILLTDGENHTQSLDTTIKRAQSEGVRVFAIGFGNPEGEIIPLRDQQGNLKGYKKDEKGTTIVSKLDEKTLQTIVSKTNGRYYRSTEGEIEVDKILKDIKNMGKKSLESRVWGHYEDRFQWPLLAALIFLLIEFLFPETHGHWKYVLGLLFQQRKKWGAGLIAFILLGSSVPAQAGGRKPSPKQIERALQATQDKINKDISNVHAHSQLGHAYYEKEEFEPSAESFERARDLATTPQLKAENAYNAGNAWLKKNEFQKSVNRYKETLRIDPTDTAAKYNLEFAQKLLKKQAQQKPQKGRNDKNKDGSKNEGNDQQKKGSQQEKSPVPQPKKGQMTKEDAERILQAIEAQEKEARKKKKEKGQQKTNMREDW